MNKKSPFSDFPIDDIRLTEALVLRRQRSYLAAPVLMTNVPHLVIVYSVTGFQFGYHGLGPMDLALNICEWYLLHTGHQGERTKRWKGLKCEKADCFLRTFDLHREFCRDFIERVPDEGTTIPFADLKNWFDDHLSGQ